ncbi:transmembrane protein [Thalictrum thalictroides]|uniref:Transmembrane protein n=1 Tax=Thalictrum thalictroides TaxID=46969 RepID=A0A7J6VCV6_THATH|nr:transmembrane protein [Thalictrum thalictroides]
MPQGHGTKKAILSCALPETAVSVVLAATIVGAAATFLQRTKASETTAAEDPLKVCEDCGGSGICAECKGEGFVLKRLSDERAEKARLSAQNMATRYTAGLPKKWSYCTKCSSARSCSKCGGSGRLSW